MQVQVFYLDTQFSVPQLEYPLGGSSKKGSHIYFLLQVFWVILLFDINVVLMLPWWPDVTIVQSDITIVVPWQLSTGNITKLPESDVLCGNITGFGVAEDPLSPQGEADPPLPQTKWYWHTAHRTKVVLCLCHAIHIVSYIPI